MLNRMRRNNPNEIETICEDEGYGPAVVLLHGYPFNRTMWRDQIAVLKDQYRVVAPDLRGLGESIAADTVAGMDQMAREVATLMDQLQIDQAVIAGLSMGGYVAFEFQHCFPDRVKALVLAGTRAPADNDQERQTRERQAARMLAHGMAGIAAETLPKLLAQETLARNPAAVDRIREMIDSTSPHGAAAAQLGMAARRDYSEDLENINVPTLIIVGTEDSIRPVSDAEFMHSRIADSQLKIMENAAHVSNFDQPEVFNATLREFLTAVA
jgi:pimeloyl-ACP methyl ester carboxylesterase